MDNLPKLQACPRCGKEPEWYSCWADYDMSMALWLVCDCKQIQAKAEAPKVMGYLGKYYVEQIVRRMSEEWDKYCKEAKDG